MLSRSRRYRIDLPLSTIVAVYTLYIHTLLIYAFSRYQQDQRYHVDIYSPTCMSTVINKAFHI